MHKHFQKLLMMAIDQKQYTRFFVKCDGDVNASQIKVLKETENS